MLRSFFGRAGLRRSRRLLIRKAGWLMAALDTRIASRASRAARRSICNKFHDAAQRQPAEKIGELHDQYGPKPVAKGQRDSIRPFTPPILHPRPPPFNA